MYCPNCHKSYDVDYWRCPECGAPLAEKQTRDSSGKQGFGIASMVLGMLALMSVWLIAPAGIFAVLSIIFGIIQLARSKKHGTSHTAKVSYSQMQAQMSVLGYDNVFIGTVEGNPEETSCEAVIDAASAAGYKKIILRPLMVVAGDHANNDMAGEDEDSWKSMFIASGKFDSIDSQITGLGSIRAIQQ